jgi:hypothetical protein
LNSAEALRRAVSLLPGPLALAVTLAPAPGYELQKYVVVAVSLAIFVTSFLLRSDGLFIVSLSCLAVLLGLVVSPAGFLYSFAVIVALLVMIDLVGLVGSLLGLTRRRTDSRSDSASSRYLGMVGKQAVRSSMVGITTFLLSVAIVSTPVPLVTFGNPVSGSGILALATILFILLASSKVTQLGRVFRKSKVASAVE